MSFNVFLTHSLGPSEQSLVWRLQTLATSHGISVYVPSRATLPERSRHLSALRSEVRLAIERADCVLAIITVHTSAAVRAELNYALKLGKLIVPIVERGVPDVNYLQRFSKVFWFSDSDPPGKLESEVVDFLKTQKVNREGTQAVGAVVAIGIGMLLLYALAKD